MNKKIKKASAITMTGAILATQVPMSVFANEVEGAAMGDEKAAQVETKQTGGVDKTQVVVPIPDDRLEAAIRNALNKPIGDITQADMETLTTLENDGTQTGRIQSLEGLEYAINLKKLLLPNNNIQDISQLEYLINLEELDISYLADPADDISVLRHLTKLKKLNLSDNNHLQDAAVVLQLPALESLTLEGYDAFDFTLISSLTNLKELNIGSTWVDNLDFLNGLDSLEILNIDNNYDITSLASLNLPSLKYLSANSVDNLSDISGLRNSPKLEYLSIAMQTSPSSTDVGVLSDISPLENLVNLKYVNLYNNVIDDVTPLANLTALTHLDLSNNQVTDVTPLGGLTSLTTLNVENNQVTDFSALSNIPNLNLVASNTQAFELTIPEGYTTLLSPFKDVNGNIVPIVNVSKGTAINGGEKIKFDSLVAGEVIQGKITQSPYQGDVVIKVVAASSPVIDVQQIIMNNEVELDINVVDGFYPTEKITLSDGTEVMGNNLNKVITKTGEYTVSVHDIAGNVFTKVIQVKVTPTTPTNPPVNNNNNNNNKPTDGANDVNKPTNGNKPGAQNTAPVIHADNITIMIGDKFDALAHATAVDKEDGKLKVQVVSNNLDNSKEGVYEITYKATDSKGLSTTKTIKVTVLNKNANQESGKDDNGATVETGLSTGATMGLGGLFMASGIPFLKRKRK